MSQEPLPSGSEDAVDSSPEPVIGDSGWGPMVRDDARNGSVEIGAVCLEWAAISDVGLVREANEDAAMVAAGMFLLADGMGGHDCGEVASAAALQALAQTTVVGVDATRDNIVSALRDAQQQIEHIDSSTGRRAGTTVTGAVLIDAEEDPQWLVLNIGDSRTYRLLGGVLEQITVDHSQVQELVDAGFLTLDQARVDPRRNVITRALGAGMEPDADFFALPVSPGERLLVCSDGLTGEVSDDEIREILLGDDSAIGAASSLVSAALAGGGRDNVTVVIADVAETTSAAVESATEGQ